MRFLISNSRWNTALILTFFGMWAWTEVREYSERKTFVTEVTSFMTTGDRFTSQDGADLREVITTNKKIISAMHRRLEAVERRVEVIETVHLNELEGNGHGYN